jgi:uncharacterized protein (TIGR03435 family)
MLGVMHGARVHTQAQSGREAASVPEFATAAITPSDSSSRLVVLRFTPDGALVIDVPVYRVLLWAFGISGDRILRVPDWTRTSRYDIEAKVDAADVPRFRELSIRDRREMVLALLENRFGLEFHHETRNIPVDTLVVAKDGPKLKESGKATQTESRLEAPAGLNPAYPREVFVQGRGVPMAAIVRVISREVGRPVVDKTGLQGKYDYTLHWIPEHSSEWPDTSPSRDGIPPPMDATSLSMSSALQEQLGLKLEVQKQPEDVIVIDRVERPSQN